MALVTAPVTVVLDTRGASRHRARDSTLTGQSSGERRVGPAPARVAVPVVLTAMPSGSTAGSAGSAGSPAAPKGFTLAPDHSIGDTTTAADTVLAAPQLLVTKKQACPVSGGDSCFPVASKACLDDDTCSAFAYSTGGTHKQSMYQTFSAGLANAVPSASMTLYAKPMACCQCPSNGAFIASKAVRVPGAWAGGLHHWHIEHQCATNGNRAGSDGKAVLFCYSDSADPSCPIGVEIDNSAGLLLCLGLAVVAAVYVGAGVVIGASRSGGRPRARGSPPVAVHPHYRQWLELYGLCRDGLFFTLGRRGSEGGAAAALLAQHDGTHQDTRASRAGSVALIGGSQSSGKSAKSGPSKSSSKSGKISKKKKDRGAKTQGSLPATEHQRRQQEEEEAAEGSKGWNGNVAAVKEVIEDKGVHSSQARIRIMM